MFVSVPHTNRRTAAQGAASTIRFHHKTSLLALTALSLFAAPVAMACEDVSVPLGHGWTGVVDGAEGLCAISKEVGDGRSLSHYSDIDNRAGTWSLSLYDAAGPKGGAIIEGDVDLELFINGRSVGMVPALASGDPGSKDWTGYQDFLISAGAMDDIIAGKPKGFKLEARLDGRPVFAIDATGAKRAFADYDACNGGLPTSWNELASAEG